LPNGGGDYGDADAPIDLGSGGGLPQDPGEISGSGGGAIHLIVDDTLTLDGMISADGQPVVVIFAAGGSGGSVWLAASVILGMGAIHADGGTGYPGCGGGGGGRIALYGNLTNFFGVTSVSGGDGYGAGNPGSVVIHR
jgi:hypothetical protein